MIATSSQSFSTVSSTWLERNTADPRAAISRIMARSS